MFELTDLAVKDTMELHLRHPATSELLYADEEKTKPVSITLHGKSSKPYRTVVTAMQNRNLRRKQKGEKASAEQMLEEGLEMLVSISADSDNLSVDGKPVKTPEQFRKLYSTPKLFWVKEQVDEAVVDVSNFLE